MKGSYLNAMQEVITRCGWMVQMVAPTADDDDPLPSSPFAYTVGVSETLHHPELIMIGRHPQVCQVILNAAAARIQAGERFVPAPGEDELLVPNLFGGGFMAAMKRVTPAAKLEYLRVAAQRYGKDAFEAIQIVMPDGRGRFPWDEHYDRQAMIGQVLLY
jgi:hypothetical protein